MLDLDDICTCKHSYKEHRRDFEKGWFDCWYNENFPDIRIWCLCQEFKLDNLRYLEKEYEKKTV